MAAGPQYLYFNGGGNRRFWPSRFSVVCGAAAYCDVYKRRSAVGSGADAFGVAIARFFRPFSMDTLARAAYAVVGDRPGIGRHSPS